MAVTVDKPRLLEHSARFFSSESIKPVSRGGAMQAEVSQEFQ